MKKFRAIEGLRGWLAWAVVLAHLAYCSGFNTGVLPAQFRSLGPPAVLVFLIVSGFVITHLSLKNRKHIQLILWSALHDCFRCLQRPALLVSLLTICLPFR